MNVRTSSLLFLPKVDLALRIKKDGSFLWWIINVTWLAPNIWTCYTVLAWLQFTREEQWIYLIFTCISKWFTYFCPWCCIYLYLPVSTTFSVLLYWVGCRLLCSALPNYLMGKIGKDITFLCLYIISWHRFISFTQRLEISKQHGLYLISL